MTKLPRNFSGRTYNTYQWGCLCWNLKDKGEGCLSGFTKFEKDPDNAYSTCMALYQQGWRCEPCSAIICLKCALVHRLTDAEKKVITDKEDAVEREKEEGKEEDVPGPDVKEKKEEAKQEEEEKKEPAHADLKGETIVYWHSNIID